MRFTWTFLCVLCAHQRVKMWNKRWKEFQTSKSIEEKTWPRKTVRCFILCLTSSLYTANLPGRNWPSAQNIQKTIKRTRFCLLFRGPLIIDTQFLKSTIFFTFLCYYLGLHVIVILYLFLRFTNILRHPNKNKYWLPNTNRFFLNNMQWCNLLCGRRSFKW